MGVHELKVEGAGSTVRLLPVGKETIHTMDLFPPYFYCHCFECVLNTVYICVYLSFPYNFCLCICHMTACVQSSSEFDPSQAGFLSKALCCDVNKHDVCMSQHVISSRH